MSVEREKDHVCIDRAVRLYLQQAPLDVLIAELKASATRAQSGKSQPGSWTSVDFQDRVASDLLGGSVAEQYPPRAAYVSRFTKVLLEECEMAGEEPSEGLLNARMACLASRGAAVVDETPYESFWVPRRRPSSWRDDAAASDACAGNTRQGFDMMRDEGAFMSFRVANRDNEVGLRVWEAGRALAEFCLAHADFLEGKSVLELGAGIGMTGLAVAGSCGVREIVLTDYAPRVLANLHLNVEINRPLLNSLTDRHSDVAVRALDWTDYIPEVESVDSPLLPCAGSNDNLEPSRVPPVINQCAADDEHLDSTDQTSTTNQIGFDGKGVGNVGRGCEEGDPLGRPDVVLAADVVYDIRYHPALIGVVMETLRRCPDAVIIFASTLRNAETMAAFHRCLEDAGIPWQRVEFPKSNATLDKDNSVYGQAQAFPCGDGNAGCGNRVSGSELWCHPEDLDKVQFCICGRGFSRLKN